MLIAIFMDLSKMMESSEVISCKAMLKFLSLIKIKETILLTLQLISCFQTNSRCKFGILLTRKIWYKLRFKKKNYHSWNTLTWNLRTLAPTNQKIIKYLLRIMFTCLEHNFSIKITMRLLWLQMLNFSLISHDWAASCNYSNLTGSVQKRSLVSQRCKVLKQRVFSHSLPWKMSNLTKIQTNSTLMQKDCPTKKSYW